MTGSLGAGRGAGVLPPVPSTSLWSGVQTRTKRPFVWRFSTIDDFCAACGLPIVFYNDSGWHHKDRKQDKRHQAIPRDAA